RTLSEVTRRRYWRVLERVYDFAVLHGWIDTNPVSQLRLAERPKAVEQLGHTLPPALWQRLPQHFAASDSLQGARDRAILLLLYELALAPEEVRGLRDEHLLDEQHQPLQPNAGVTPRWLKIEGARKAQHRTLPVPVHVGEALVAWHQYRHAHDATLQGWLFHSRKGGPLSIRALFHVASRVIQEAHAALPADTQHWPLQRVGPQVLRNTAIVTWLQAGVPESEVVRRLGVESGRALVRLQYKLGTVRTTPPPSAAAAHEQSDSATKIAPSAAKPPAP
ncbi:MAG: tyrosine-type recombinase/integrase, partial [Simplicispira sp.]|nr:tyrosine-type recombinase/integrase [Simplicispira sp.]